MDSDKKQMDLLKSHFGDAIDHETASKAIHDSQALCLTSLTKLRETQEEISRLISSFYMLFSANASKADPDHDFHPVDTLKNLCQRLLNDVRSFEQILAPLCDNGLLTEHSQKLLSLAFDQVEHETHRRALGPLQEEANGGSAKNWAYPSPLYGARLSKTWESFCVLVIGPQGDIIKDRWRGDHGEVLARNGGPFRNLTMTAQAAMINVVDGNIAVALAKVIDPNRALGSFTRMFVYSTPKCKKDAPVPLCQVHVKLQAKVGHKCTKRH